MRLLSSKMSREWQTTDILQDSDKVLISCQSPGRSSICGVTIATQSNQGFSESPSLPLIMPRHRRPNWMAGETNAVGT
jgi:hypothetical protein